MHRPALAALSLLLLLLAGPAQGGEPEEAEFARSVPGVRVQYRDPLGNPAQVEGVLEREDASSLTIRSVDGPLEIERSRVIEIAPLTLDPRTLYPAAELLARYVAARQARHADDAALSSADHWHVALYAEWLEAWAAARDHYAQAAADPTFPRHVAAAEHAERIAARLRDLAALEALAQAAHWLRMSRFREARAALAAFPEEHPDVSEAVSAKHALLLQTFSGVRKQVLQLRVERAFPDSVRELIRSQVQRVDVSLADVTAWARRELPDAAFAAVRASLAKLDDVTPEEVVRFWDERRRFNSRRASYGGGTYIVEPPAGTPPTRDAWWDAAPTAERVAWTLAFFIERSGLFEVRKREQLTCPLCRGTGRVTRRLASGAVLTYLCSRCHGLTYEVLLHYR